MRRSIGDRLVRHAAGGCAALLLLLTGGSVQAQLPDPEVEALRARLEKLEKQNEDLQQTVKSLHQGVSTAEEGAAPKGGEGAAPSKATVEKIVGDYIKKKDEEKKQKDEQTKKEEEAKGYEVGSDLNMKAKWKPSYGLVFETPGKDFLLHVGGRAQVDYTFFFPEAGLEPRGWSDGVQFRRLRMQVDGTMWEVVNWIVELDFATAGTTETKDAYIEVAKLPYVGTFRVGHYKEPLSLENWGTSDNYTTFLERNTAFEAFERDRNTGMTLYNTAFCDKIAWQTGFFRSNSFINDGLVEDAGDGEYAYDARVCFNPWYENEGRCAFMVGGSYSYRSTINQPSGTIANPTGDDPRFRTRIPIRQRSVPFLPSERVIDTGTLLENSYEMMNAEALLVLGSFSLQGEYYRVQNHDLIRGKVLRDPAFDGFYVQASYFLTGEYRPYNRKIGGIGGPAIIEPFYFVEAGDHCDLHSIFGRGAWELAVRYEYVDLGSPALDQIGTGKNAVAAVTTRGREQDVTVGLNWYLNPQTIIRFNYVYAHVDGTGANATTRTGDVQAIGTRFQINF